MKNYIYYDSEGDITFTIRCNPEVAPAGDKVETQLTLEEFDLARNKVVNGVLEYTPPNYAELQSVLSEEVNRERDRRLPMPFNFNGSLYDRDPTSVARISGAGTLALGAIIGGAQPGNLRWHGGNNDFGWIDYNGNINTMDAQTVFAFGQAAAERETLIVFSAKSLKTMDPIPEDYANDIYWPAP